MYILQRAPLVLAPFCPQPRRARRHRGARAERLADKTRRGPYYYFIIITIISIIVLLLLLQLLISHQRGQTREFCEPGFRCLSSHLLWKSCGESLRFAEATIFHCKITKQYSGDSQRLRIHTKTA